VVISVTKVVVLSKDEVVGVTVLTVVAVPVEVTTVVSTISKQALITSFRTATGEPGCAAST
jgi:hypothetical protein